MTVYKVKATREGDKWTADVPDVPGAHTWARSIEGLDANVREVIALVLDLPEGVEADLDLQWDYETGHADWDEATAALRAARREVDEKAAALAQRTTQIAAELVRSFSVRDVAALLSVSYQRISQVAPKVAKKAPPTVTVKRVAPVPPARKAVAAKNAVARKGAVENAPARRKSNA